MKKTTTVHERIAVRAYFLWLAGAPGSATDHWLEAEAIETALAERRAAAAVKAAQTRRAKRFSPELVKTDPAEMLVAAKRRPANRPTPH